MSFPAAAATVATAAASVANPIDAFMATVNTNPYVIGLMMLMLNLGGRFLALEITKEQEKILSLPWVRRFFLFAVIFIATRNLIIAIGLTILVIILIGYLFNENSDLCIWYPLTKDKVEIKPAANYVGLTPEEGMILKRLNDKQVAAMTGATEEKKEDPIIPASSIYNNSLKMFNFQ
jgi:hypothetical protein